MAARYDWVITKDHMADKDQPEGTVWNAVGVKGPAHGKKTGEEILAGEGEEFRMFDDDDNLIYEGKIVGDYNGFEPKDDFGEGNAGCTRIQYKVDGIWKDL